METILFRGLKIQIGSFGPKQIISSVIKPVKIYAADLDNDGDIDVVSVTHDDLGGSVFWHENIDGLGTFSPKQVISENILGGRGVFAEDLDGDGDMDVLSASIVDYKIAWYENLTILGIADNIINSFNIYPNPVQDIVNIENSSSFTINKIQIYDALGRILFEEYYPTNQINISNLASGLLFVQLETNKGTITKKVMKE